jgi:cbb3-type cytochrome c oxidase subunit III
LTVKLDPDVREGFVEKAITVASNDPARPTAIIKVRAEVELNIHEKSGLDTNRPILSAECRSCHFDEGAGKLGHDLYVADCAPCHGPINDSDHKRRLSGPALARNLEALRVAIATGTSDRHMPGFARSAGGPLSDSQIDSLVALFKKWSAAEQRKHRKRK